MNATGSRPTILFVCTGNTCRSPLAEAVARRLVERLGLNVAVGSAGTSALDGTPASQLAVQVGREAGLDLAAHTARLVTRSLVLQADLVLVMSTSHRRLLHVLAPEADSRLHLLGDYAGGTTAGAEVDDPIGGGPETYRRTLLEIESLVELCLQRFLADAASRKG